jgi:hypothetical protein
MKIITKAIIDMDTLETVEEESYEYEGFIAQVKGGGSSGDMDWPSYMKTAHRWALSGDGSEYLSHGVSYYIDALIDNPPYMDYLPDTMDDMFGERPTTVFNIFDTNLNMDVVEVFNNINLSVSTSPAHEALLNAEIDLMNDDLDGTVLPRFQTGMRDMQCVMTSAFSIGQAMIEAKKNLAVANLIATHNKELLHLSGQIFQQYLEWHKRLVDHAIEAARIYAAGKFDETKFISEANVKSYLWNLELYQYFCSVLASISGTSPISTGGNSGGSTVTNTIGGALSGTATGAMAGAAMGSGGGPIGAGIGAVVGGIAGALS